MRAAVIGWDIGGVNTKAVRCAPRADGAPALESRCLPYELQRDPAALGPAIAGLARELGAEGVGPHAVTMTAELSQAFRRKRDGVAFVLDALESALPAAELHVYAVGGRFLTPVEARREPLAVAASNWHATASLVARSEPDCVVVDVGTTTTDIIPVVGGTVVALGRTDPERLLSGELVYTGALRTPAEAVAARVPLWGGSAGASADGFALIGDAHLWRGTLDPADYTVATPDGRPATREFAGERLARVVCADREMLDDPAVDAIARALVEAQLDRVLEGLGRVCGRWPAVTTAVVTGLGDFIAAEAAAVVGLSVRRLADELGAAARTAPAAAVAWLLADRLARPKA